MVKYIKLTVIFIIPLILLCGCGNSEPVNIHNAKVVIYVADVGFPERDSYIFEVKSDGLLDVTAINAGVHKTKKLSRRKAKEIDKLINDVENNSTENLQVGVLDSSIIFAEINGRRFASEYIYDERFEDQSDIYLQALAYKLVRVSPIKVKLP